VYVSIFFSSSYDLRSNMGCTAFIVIFVLKILVYAS